MNEHPLAAAIASAVADRDSSQLAAAVTEGVRLRALLPGGPIEEHGRASLPLGAGQETSTVTLVGLVRMS